MKVGPPGFSNTTTIVVSQTLNWLVAEALLRPFWTRPTQTCKSFNLTDIVVLVIIMSNRRRRSSREDHQNLIAAYLFFRERRLMDNRLV